MLEQVWARDTEGLTELLRQVQRAYPWYEGLCLKENVRARCSRGPFCLGGRDTFEISEQGELEVFDVPWLEFRDVRP